MDRVTPEMQRSQEKEPKKAILEIHTSCLSVWRSAAFQVRKGHETCSSRHVEERVGKLVLF